MDSKKKFSGAQLYIQYIWNIYEFEKCLFISNDTKLKPQIIDFVFVGGGCMYECVF